MTKKQYLGLIIRYAFRKDKEPKLRYPCPIEGEINWEYLEKDYYEELGPKVNMLPNCLKADLS